jgi:8-oxo-dGTP pyrophosphatase MutT (NUDIX family)
VAGTVEQGEEYDDNMVKEIAEEIGLTVRMDELTKGIKEYVDGTHHDIFVQWYVLQRDISIEQFVYPPEEVVALRYVPFDELVVWAQQKPEEFSAGFRAMILHIHEQGMTAVLGA